MSSLSATSLQSIGNGWKRFSNQVCNKLTDKVQKFLNQHAGADLIIVTGPGGVGKSSYIKSITGENVNVGSTLESGTKTTSLVPVVIGGKRYLFLDMPGFNTVDFDDWDIFYRLMTALSIVHTYTVFRSVIYVDEVKETRITPQACKILTWLFLFCGRDYMPNVTVVTTKRDGLNEYGIQDKLSLVEKWCEDELFKSAGRYETLHLINDREDRASRAQHEIMARYQNPTNLKLQAYIEIASGATVDQTHAGRWLRHGHMADNGPADSHHDEDDEGNTTPPSDDSPSSDQTQDQNQHARQATGNDDSSSNPSPSNGFWDFWKDLRYEDVKPWVSLLINAAREYMKSERASSNEYFPDPFEDYESTDAFREAPSFQAFFDEPEPEFSSQPETSCWPL
ncbi:hypothetical protein UA08_08506 [Talaromyces atroroseus]|uniref:G domain-containing protein n=1 Tax=Talaromyces atroroseus TaxID=1441469 RepID=A0A1Q5Q7R4_TALAT|nr:hypothetical protein UA08_08506 [Talaromyces atroroseus]OKL56258.1 hypothetical protein UA08_08506 [Talaromyces atroroseus]